MLTENLVAIVALILRRPFNVVDHDHRNGTLGGFQSQAKLLNSREQIRLPRIFRLYRRHPRTCIVRNDKGAFFPIPVNENDLVARTSPSTAAVGPVLSISRDGDSRFDCFR